MDFFDDIFEAIPDEYDKFDAYSYALKKYGYTTIQRQTWPISTDICLTINDIVFLTYNKNNDSVSLHVVAYKRKARYSPMKTAKNPIHMLRILSNWSVDVPALVAKTLSR